MAEQLVLYGEKEIRFGNHDLLVMLPNERIHYKALEPWNITWVGLYGETVSKFMEFFDITPQNPIMHISLYNELNSIMDKIYNTSKDTSISSKLSITGLIYEFFSVLMQNANITKQNENIIKAALRIIDYNYTSPITINQIAERLSLNSSYFSRIFTEQTGMSPKQYILNKRMERAKELLKETDISVYEIAYSVGYEDQLYFSRIFKKHIGMPPLEFRKSAQAEPQL